MARKKKLEIDEIKEKNESGDGYYVTNDALMEELIKTHERADRYEELGIKKSPVTTNLAIMFQAIATKLSSSSHFTYKMKEDQEDCIGYAVMDCIKYWDSFLREPLPVVDESGHLVFDDNGDVKYERVKFKKNLMIPVVNVEKDDNGRKVLGEDKKPLRTIVFNSDGTVKMQKPNPFSYFTSVCTNGLGKGWKALGYTDLPFAKRVYITESIFSI